MVPRCLRPTPMATWGFSTAFFLLWSLGLSGFSHWAGMAEPQFRSKFWAVLLPRSHQGHAHLLVGILTTHQKLTWSVDSVNSCLDWYYDVTADSPSIKVNMGTPRTSPTPTPTEGPVLVETRLSMYLCHLLISNVYNKEEYVKKQCNISFCHSALCTLQ